MRAYKITLIFLAGLGLLAGSAAEAQFGGAEFSAEIIQKGPQGQESTGRMFVGKDRIRMDMTQNDQKIIRIIDNARQTEWLLFPGQDTYMEMRTQGPAGQEAAKPSGRNPCEGMQGVSCKKQGKEKVSGRETTKWQLAFEYQGKTLMETQWIDDERGIPLRRDMPNGQSTELHLLGADSIDGRPVEKWEMISVQGSETPQRSYQWYDPKLKLVVREEFPGGYVRELRNIREGKQSDSLFSIPAGYRQVTAPTPEKSQSR